MVVKKLGVALVVALALLALMEPAAAGVKFADEDVESEEALWRLYERWLAHFNVSRHPAEKVRRFSLFKEAERDNRGILDLSEQELVDCDNNGHGCRGGSRAYALDYIAKKGISSEADYPYTATNGTCQAAGKPRVDLIVRGYETVRPYDEFDLLTAVGYGPVAVAISVGEKNNRFQYYEDGDGIYDGPCTRETRHSILLQMDSASTLFLNPGHVYSS
ncbi:unnamed protein product [Urochloa decumbens]|uniref:Peptidase C1A papain C-terminal domain-containing protein n=1 Tax=Urochloa decumbens TaxID=240449 RepID=A0ABC9GLW2_9POAL